MQELVHETLPNPVIERGPVTAEFTWNDDRCVVTRRSEQDFVLDIYQPHNDGSFPVSPNHTVEGITSLLQLRTILQDLFSRKVI